MVHLKQRDITCELLPAWKVHKNRMKLRVILGVFLPLGLRDLLLVILRYKLTRMLWHHRCLCWAHCLFWMLLTTTCVCSRFARRPACACVSMLLHAVSEQKAHVRQSSIEALLHVAWYCKTWVAVHAPGVRIQCSVHSTAAMQGGYKRHAIRTEQEKNCVSDLTCALL